MEMLIFEEKHVHLPSTEHSGTATSVFAEAKMIIGIRLIINVLV